MLIADDEKRDDTGMRETSYIPLTAPYLWRRLRPSWVSFHWRLANRSLAPNVRIDKTQPLAVHRPKCKRAEKVDWWHSRIR